MFSLSWEHYIYIQIYAKRFICLKSDKTSPENCGVEIITDKDSSSFFLERTGIKKLVLDDDVTKKAGIIPFILSDRTWRDEKHLSLRAFTESQKLRAYERQGHKCPLCVANGINTEYAFEDMEGDHIIPWSKGGHTTGDNLQMLCKKCNAAKSDKWHTPTPHSGSSLCRGCNKFPFRNPQRIRTDK